MEKIAAFILFLIIDFGISSAQIPDSDPSKTVLKLASEKSYKEAIAICDSILQEQPYNIDFQLMKARLSAWSGDLNNAERLLKQILEQKPLHFEALSALSDVYTWQHKNSEAIEVIDQLLQQNAEDKELYLKKINLCVTLKRYDEAWEMIHLLEDKYPEDNEVAFLRRNLKNLAWKNAISVQYIHSQFSKLYEPWHIAAIEYQRKEKAFTAAARINYGDMFHLNGMQYELDVYPKFKNSYLYLNTSFSEDIIFPKYRGALEYFVDLKHSFEASAGAKYLTFEKTSVWIYTGSIGKYLGNYFFWVRPYFTSKEKEISFTGTVSARRYFPDADNFVGITLASGSNAQDFTFVQEIQRLRSQRIETEFQVKIVGHTLLRTNIGLLNEEYFEGKYIRRFSGGISISYRF